MHSQPPLLLPPPVAYCVPHCALFRSMRRATTVTAAAIALALQPLSHASAAAPTTISTPSPPRRSRPSVAPVIVIDRDYDPTRAPVWQFDTTPTPPLLPPVQTSTARPRTRPRYVLPPGPELGDELRILNRLLVALVVGGFIGMERRAANSLAGVRTFSLVSLGAAIFMCTTLVAFPTADPTRVAAAISSSVGFLGAGVMHKNSKHSRGLTTASSVWLAAALGIAAACGMFLLSFTGAVATVLIARYARFDSSLHLIRGGRRREGGEDDELPMEADGGEGAGAFAIAGRKRNGVGAVFDGRTQDGGVFRPELAGSGKAGAFQLQSLVDYDPRTSGEVAADTGRNGEDADVGPDGIGESERDPDDGASL